MDGDEPIGVEAACELDGEEVVREGCCAALGVEGVWGVEGDGAERTANELLAMGAGLFCGECAESGHALIHNGRRDGLLGVENPGAGAWAGREREEMEIAEGQRTDDFQRLLKLAVGFTGEAGHDVGTEGEIGAGGAEERVNPGLVMPGAVATVHAAEDGV